MEIAYSLSELWRLRRWLALVVIVAGFCALLVTHQVKLGPPFLEKKPALELGSGSTELLLDTPRSAIGDLDTNLEILSGRTSIVANLIETKRVKDDVARRLGLSSGAVAADVQRPNPESGARASDLVVENAGFRISARPEGEVPIVNITAQAPSAAAAKALANATVQSLSAYIVNLQRRDDIPELNRVRVRQLGPATGGLLNPGASKTGTLLAFIGTLLAGCLLILLVSRIAGDRQARARGDAEPGIGGLAGGVPNGSGAPNGNGHARPSGLQLQYDPDVDRPVLSKVAADESPEPREGRRWFGAPRS